MTDQFIGEIRLVGFTFAPKAWALCNGKVLPISQNTALFSLLGTNFGGDGKSTFGLPDLRDRLAMGWGDGPGLTPRSIGENAGEPAVPLQTKEMPAHPHQLRAFDGTGDDPTPQSHALARYPGAYQSDQRADQKPMSPQALTVQGGGGPHNNLMPFQAALYIIALQGIYPARP